MAGLDRDQRALARAGPRHPRRQPGGDAAIPDTGEPRIVQQVRGQFAGWAAVSLGCFGINVATGLDTPWFLFPTFGMGIGMLKNYAKLWQSGYSWRDVLTRPPAPDAVETMMTKGAKLPRRMPQPTAEEFGAYLPQMLQVQSDRFAIAKLMEKLPASERKMLPEVQQTVDALCERATDLARTLHAMDSNLDSEGLGSIDQRIAALSSPPPQSAPAPAADDPRSAGPPRPGGEPPGILRPGDAERALRPPAAPLRRRGGCAGRPDSGHPAGQGALPRRRQRHRRRGGDPGGDEVVRTSARQHRPVTGGGRHDRG
jgi:hypothetical protein